MGNVCVKGETDANTEGAANNKVKEINTVEEGAADNEAKEINTVEEGAADNQAKEINTVEEGAVNHPANTVENDEGAVNAPANTVKNVGAVNDPAKEIGSVDNDEGAAKHPVEEAAASDSTGETDAVVEEAANDPAKEIGKVENVASGLVRHSSPPKPQVEVRDPCVELTTRTSKSPSHVVTSAGILTLSGVDSEDAEAGDLKSDLVLSGEVKEARPEDLGQQHNSNDRESEAANEVVLSSCEIPINQEKDLEKSGQTESTINSLPSSPVQEEELLPEVVEQPPKLDSMTSSEPERPDSRSESGESTPVALEQPSKSENLIFESESQSNLLPEILDQSSQLEKSTPELEFQPLPESSPPELEPSSEQCLEPFGKPEPEPLAEVEVSTEVLALEEPHKLEVSNSMSANESSRPEASPDGKESPQADLVLEHMEPSPEPEESITHIVTPNSESLLHDKSFPRQPGPSQISEPEETEPEKSFPRDLELSSQRAEELSLELEEPLAQGEPEEPSSPVESESNPHISELEEPGPSLQESSPHFEMSSPHSEQENLPLPSVEPSQCEPKESISLLDNFSGPEDPSLQLEKTSDPEESSQDEESFPQAEPEEAFPQIESEETFPQAEPVECEEPSPEVEPQLSESEDFSRDNIPLP